MKIAILSFYSGHLTRGVENWTQQLANRLAKNHNITVFQNGPTPRLVNYEVISTNLPVNWDQKDPRGTLARRFFVNYWSRLIARSTLKILPTLFRRHFDIIIPTNGGWQPALIRLLTWVSGGRVVIVGHSGRGWDDRNNLWCFPDTFVALSFSFQKWAKKANPFVRTTHIPNGIDLNLFTPFGSKAEIPLERPIILAVGALEKGKRLELAIEAVSKLKKGSLLILGRGYEEERIKSLGKRFLGKRFLMKTVPFNEIPNYYRSADLFTLPSWEREAFGMVFLEAMASGLPVVATDDEVRREIIGDVGILVDPTKIDSYAKALEHALNTDWGKKPRKQAEKFSWEKVVQRYERLFQNLAKR